MGSGIGDMWEGMTSAIPGVGEYRAGKAAERGQEKAMAAQERIAERNLAFLRDIYEQGQEQMAPYQAAGERALGRLESFQAPSFSLADFEASPDYQFLLQEGERELLSGASAGGMRISGRTLKALQDYGQQTASREYGNWYARQAGQSQDAWNRMASIAGIGQSSSQAAMAAGGQYGGMGSGVLGNLGAALGQGYGNIGDIRAASILGQSAAQNRFRQQEFSNNMMLAQTGGSIFGSMMGGMM